MVLVGLTGSIGMGKSTTAQLFAEEGCAVWDADAAVHRLYAPGGAAVEPMRAAFPEALGPDGISREVLKRLISAEPAILKKVEEIVHPLVTQDRADFIASATSDIVVCDIPLLFETGGDRQMDVTVCVCVDAETQKDRVMARGTMSPEQFETIRLKQMPIDEKCAKADHVIVTDTLAHARSQVGKIVSDIRNRVKHA